MCAAAISFLRARPGEVAIQYRSRLLVHTQRYSMSARSSSACSASALSPPDGPVTTASAAGGGVHTSRSRSCRYGAEPSAVPADPNPAAEACPASSPPTRRSSRAACHRPRWRGSHGRRARRPTRPAPCPAAAAPAPVRPPPRGAQHRVGLHRERHVPGQQRQVAEQRGQDLAVAGPRHQGHQLPTRSAAAIVIARRAPPLTFPAAPSPPRPHRSRRAARPPHPAAPRGSRAGGSADARRPATARRGDDRRPTRRPAEHHHAPARTSASAAASAVRPPAAAAAAAGTAGQPPAPRPTPHPPSGGPGWDGSGTGGRRHGTVQRHEGLPGHRRAIAPASRTGGPVRKPVTRA